jgi:hypothetical protein
MYDAVIRKKCAKCKKKKPISRFNNSKTGMYGKDAQCKKCKREAHRIRDAAYKAKYGGRVKIRRSSKDLIYRQINRGIVAKMLCFYRHRFKVLKDADISIDLHIKATEAELIANNNRIDRTLEAAGLGDKRVDRWEKLQ